MAPRFLVARVAGVVSVLGLLSSSARALVTSEIHYHPRPGEEALEFVELGNDSSTPEDLSGYAFVEGISFVFPQGTILPGGGFLVIAADAAAVRARHGIANVLGDYARQLDDGGERLTLVNHTGVVIQTLAYNDRGKWPVAPDGAGHSLVLRSLHLDPREPESWDASPQLGGSPGQANFPAADPPRRIPEAMLVFNEIQRGAGQAAGWVEIYNGGSNAVELSGLRLADDPARVNPYAFPQGTLIQPRAFLLVGAGEAGLSLPLPKTQLFLSRPDGIVASAAAFDAEPPGGMEVGAWSEARFPDGGRPGWISDTPTPGTANRVRRVTDLVINEIFYHPPEDRRGEFVELHNRGAAPLDVSGFRFTNGVAFAIPEGTVLAPGGYLVVAEDPVSLAAAHGLSGVLGPYEGRLADGGENVRIVDRLGNLVDEVRYWDGGAWSATADAQGASLELVDPRQDNDFASAWEASDESAKAAWEPLAFEAPDFVPAEATELHLYLVTQGACRLDEVAVRRVGDDHNWIPNGGFEAGTAPWRIVGTHVHSRRFAGDGRSGEASLELIATGKGDTACNHIETDTSPRLAAGAYEVSLWARWLRGSSLLVVHGEFTPGPWGPLSGSTMAARLRMTVPLNLGTPGAENSATRRLRAETGGVNLGPAIEGVSHSPPSPAPDEPASVKACVADADGVASVKVFYRTDSAEGEFSGIELSDDGLHDDAGEGDGVFGGVLPSFPVMTKVVFYVEASDLLGRTRRYPVEAPERTCVYMVERGIATTRDFYRVILDSRRTAELQGRPLHSNDLLEGTFIYRNEEIFYAMAARYRGSPWGRPLRQNLRIHFAKDNRFHRGRRGLSLTSKGASPNEGVAYFLVSRNGTLQKPAAAAEYLYAGVTFNGLNLGIQGAIQPIDGDYVAKWYGEEAVEEAVVLKAVGRLSFNDDCQMEAFDGASLLHRGANTEDHRAYWFHSIHKSRDRWEPFLALTKVMDPGQTADEQFDTELDGVLDVEAFLRVLSARVLVGSTDALFITGGHNGLMVQDPRDHLWELLPFDIDSSFGDTLGLFPAGEPSIVRFLSRPSPRRAYLRILAQAADGYWSLPNVGPFLDALEADVKIPARGLKAFIGAQAGRLRETVGPFINAPFRILTGEDGEATTDGPLIQLEGEAPVQVQLLSAIRAGGQPEQFDPTWVAPTTWRAPFQVPRAVNPLEVIGFDAAGNVAGRAAITVRNTSAAPDGDFVRGDVVGDGALNITDAIGMLLHLFRGTTLTCLDAADADDNGELEIADPLRILSYLFLRGPPPPLPGPPPGSCDADPTPDLLDCEQYAGCGG